MRFEIVVERSDNGSFRASCPNLPGCSVEGKSRREALLRVKKAILDFIGMSVDFTIRQILTPGPYAGTDMISPAPPLPSQVFYTQKMERMKLPFSNLPPETEEIFQVGIPLCFN